MKECRRCGEFKLSSEFRKNKNMSDGLQYYCKPCSAKMCKESKRKHMDTVRKHRRLYKIRHPKVTYKRIVLERLRKYTNA